MSMCGQFSACHLLAKRVPPLQGLALILTAWRQGQCGSGRQRDLPSPSNARSRYCVASSVWRAYRNKPPGRAAVLSWCSFCLARRVLPLRARAPPDGAFWDAPSSGGAYSRCALQLTSVAAAAALCGSRWRTASELRHGAFLSSASRLDFSFCRLYVRGCVCLSLPCVSSPRRALNTSSIG